MALLAFISLFLPVCTSPEAFDIKGTTMGTGYSVLVADAPSGVRSRVERDIASRLEDINSLLSAYRPDSEISRFNFLTDTGTPSPVSQDFQAVLQISTHVHELTDGAFDPTVKPLIDVWGVGADPPHQHGRRPPPTRLVQAALDSIGLQKIDVSLPGHILKTASGVRLDFGGVAKGYAVDQVAGILQKQGIKNFLVDIGGDILASGKNPTGEHWRVGVNLPDPDAGLEEVLMVLCIKDRAVATSGDYRRHFIHEGLLYGHVLDPRTGYPVNNEVASVTVIAETAAFADALATGLMVLGAAAGLELVDRLSEVEALFILRHAGGHAVRMSSGFAAVTGLDGGEREDYSETSCFDED